MANVDHTAFVNELLAPFDDAHLHAPRDVDGARVFASWTGERIVSFVETEHGPSRQWRSVLGNETATHAFVGVGDKEILHHVDHNGTERVFTRDASGKGWTLVDPSAADLAQGSADWLGGPLEQERPAAAAATTAATAAATTTTTVNRVDVAQAPGMDVAETTTVTTTTTTTTVTMNPSNDAGKGVLLDLSQNGAAPIPVVVVAAEDDDDDESPAVRTYRFAFPEGAPQQETLPSLRLRVMAHKAPGDFERIHIPGGRWVFEPRET